MSNKNLRIGVTMRVISAQGYIEPRDALAQNWAQFLAVAFPDTCWMLLPNLGAASICAYCERWGINRLLLTGGEDLGITPLRDETERALLAWAEDRQIPVLGVCRGMQIMATYAGATLKPLEGHVRKRHILCGELVHEVNSFHNYGLVDSPNGFVASAKAEDGEIEAICNTGLHWEGWMWHPEREELFNPADIDRLRKLFA